MNSIRSAMSQADASLENLLISFANDFLEPLMGKSNDGIFIKLMMRERLNPQLSHALFFQEVIMPVVTELQKALSKIEPDLTTEKSLACIRSFIAQLINIIHLLLGNLFNELTQIFTFVQIKFTLHQLLKFW